ncbi:hypothetical protein U1Q18_033873 [Sarracenia purpurea var. burkii]
MAIIVSSVDHNVLEPRRTVGSEPIGELAEGGGMCSNVERRAEKGAEMVVRSKDKLRRRRRMGEEGWWRREWGEAAHHCVLTGIPSGFSCGGSLFLMSILVSSQRL